MTIDPQRAQALFLAAVELSEPTARRELLDRECAGDDPLRQRVTALLGAHAAAKGFGDKASRDAFEVTIDSSIGMHSGSMVDGRYKLIEAIGEGGMGTVWLAEQKEPVKRKVAIKLIKAGMDSRQVLARFEAERQALAMMDHPNIAKVFDGGMTEQGRPYFAMEFVKGVPLTEYCDQARLSLKERLNLFIPVCQAVQHAHQKGIIHRDLKPSNILICLYDGKPVPKVIDFGLAKAIHQSLTEHTLHTAFGMMVGTPLYMSPEQAEHNNLDVDTRTDIYSLGVILYELLTGGTPLEKQQLMDAAFNEILRLIKDVEPPKPSTRLSGSAKLPSIAAHRSIDPKQLSKSLSGDLDWIVMKALDKERSRRYETANGLARDVERFLHDEAVEASPPSSSYRLRKLIRKHRIAINTSVAFVVLLIAGIVVSTWQAVRATTAEGNAELALANEFKQRKIAEVNQRNAEEAQLRAETAAHNESLQRAAAEKARDQTQRSLDAMTSAATGDALTSQNELSSDQKRFLSEVLTYYQEFTALHPDDEKARVRSAEAATRVGEIESRLGRKEESSVAFRMAIGTYSKLSEEFPSQPAYRQALAKSYSNLGLILTQLGKLEEGAEKYRLALKIHELLTQDLDDNSEYLLELAITRNKFALVLLPLGRWEEARQLCNQGLDILKRLATINPASPNYRHELARCHGNLGIILNGAGQFRESLAEMRISLSLFEALLEDYPEERKYRQELAIKHNNVGFMVSILDQKESAVDHYLKAISHRERLAVDFPSMPEYRRELAKGHAGLGELLASMGQFEPAAKHCNKALELLEILVHLYPEDPVYQQDLGRNYGSLGIVLNGMARHSEVVDQFVHSLAVFESLAEKFPANIQYRQEVATGHNNLGALLTELGRREEAVTHHETARTIRAILRAEHPAVPSYLYDLSYSQNNLGSLQAEMGHYEDALKSLQEALANSEKLTSENAEVTGYQILLGFIHYNLGDLYLLKGRPAESLDWFMKGIEIESKILKTGQRDTTAELILRSCQRGQVKAQLLLEQINEIDPQVVEIVNGDHWDMHDWYDLACVYSIASKMNEIHNQEYSDRAMKLLTRAIESGWKDVELLKSDTELDPLRERDDFKTLTAELASKN